MILHVCSASHYLSLFLVQRLIMQVEVSAHTGMVQAASLYADLARRALSS